MGKARKNVGRMKGFGGKKQLTHLKKSLKRLLRWVSRWEEMLFSGP